MILLPSAQHDDLWELCADRQVLDLNLPSNARPDEQLEKEVEYAPACLLPIQRAADQLEWFIARSVTLFPSLCCPFHDETYTTFAVFTLAVDEPILDEPLSAISSLDV